MTCQTVLSSEAFVGGLADDSSSGAYKEYFLSSALPTEKCDQTKPKIEVCNLTTKQMESIFEDQFDAAKYSKNAADCRQTSTTKQITVCDLATKRLITIAEDKFDATKHSRKTTSCGSTANDDQNPGSNNGNGGGSGGGSGGTSPSPTNPPGGGDGRP